MDAVNHPKHYAGYPATVECIDITRHLSFDLGNAVKYVWRAGKKGDKAKAIEDLKKAKWYLRDWYNSAVDDDLCTARGVFRLIDKSTMEIGTYTVIEYILSLRVEEAIKLLDDTINSNENN